MERSYLDHEVILRAALAQHARAMEAAHKKLVATAIKISMATKDRSLVTSALAISNTYSYQASWAAWETKNQIDAAYTKYNNNRAKRAREPDSDGESCTTASITKKAA